MSTEPFAASVVPINIEDEMRISYLDYSMSVIIGRALPDVRDGLKPVHRRILYAMYSEGLLASRKYSKCAGVVGEVLKKYHPHGDFAVYDALVRMAQPWNMRYPLVDGQGNFGSPDGDAAAAYRYTECRMQKVAEELLRDIDKETVAYSPNFDGSHLEPDVLPARFPNLLVNGSEGIAVGMATKIPPHNLVEVINATIALIDDSELSDAALMDRYIPGPDFPTGGIIYGREGIRDAYLTGRGRIVVRARTHVEDVSAERQAIIVDELPFQVGANRIMEQVAELVRDKRIEGIAAIRDESDRTGRRVVIELRRDAFADIVLNKLFKHTDLQATFGVILLAIVNGQPRVLTLGELLRQYIAHRRDVITRRCRYELRKARERAHILEGYRIALDHLDEVIATIRAARDSEEARDNLMARFGFSEIQARHILDLQLRRLTGLERDKIEQEYAEVLATIDRLEAILASDALLMQVVKDELIEVRDAFDSPRRTEIIDSRSDLNILDLIAEQEQVVTLSVNGYIKRTPPDQYQEQRRGGLGRKGMATREEDSVRDIFVANTHSDLLVFTRGGQVYRLPVHAVPEASRDARGKPIINLVPLEMGDEIASVLAVRELSDDKDLIFCSRRGLVKRTSLGEYRNIKSTGLRAYDCAEGDSLLCVVLRQAEPYLFIATRQGSAIRFNIDEELRHLGRVARGVKGIEIEEGDEIVGMDVLAEDPGLELLAITENGYGKRTEMAEYRIQGRGGKGIINIKTDEKNGLVAGSLQVHDDDRVMLITNTGRVIKVAVAEIKSQGRATMGVRVMRVGDEERVVGVARVVEDDDDSSGLETPVMDEDDAPAGEGEE